MNDLIFMLILLAWGLLGLSVCVVGIAFVTKAIFGKNSKKLK